MTTRSLFLFSFVPVVVQRTHPSSIQWYDAKLIHLMPVHWRNVHRNYQRQFQQRHWRQRSRILRATTRGDLPEWHGTERTSDVRQRKQQQQQQQHLHKEFRLSIFVAMHVHVVNWQIAAPRDRTVRHQKDSIYRNRCVPRRHSYPDERDQCHPLDDETSENWKLLFV